MVVNTDKNLGPGVIEQKIYVQKALSKHLLDSSTYCQLEEREPRDRVTAITKIVHSFLDTWKSVLDSNAVRFIRQLLIVDHPFPHFYLLFKIHKNPMRTQHIVSIAGSILHGLGCWIDTQLQPICRRIPTYIASSLDFLEAIKPIPALPPGT